MWKLALGKWVKHTLPILCLLLTSCADDIPAPLTERSVEEMLVPALVSSDPPEGSTITPERQITLMFKKPVSSVTVNGKPAKILDTQAIFKGDFGSGNLLVKWESPQGTSQKTLKFDVKPAQSGNNVGPVPNQTSGGVISTKTIIGKDGAEMALIPAGEFLMGSPEGEGNPDEHPQHTLYLDAFYIDKYEVTNAQYKKFMEATGHASPGYWNDNRFNKPEQPVVGVSWFDAEAYSKWAGKRLLTEAEWEKAARGTDGRKYPWGNEAPNAGGIWRANYDPGNYTEDGFRYTAPVGSFPAGVSPYGVMDMAGNVWEWVADWYDSNYYNVSPKNNPKGPNSGTYRVLLGGSWFNNDNFLRAALRVGDFPGGRGGDFGFRCAQDIQ